MAAALTFLAGTGVLGLLYSWVRFTVLFRLAMLCGSGVVRSIENVEAGDGIEKKFPGTFGRGIRRPHRARDGSPDVFCFARLVPPPLGVFALEHRIIIW